MRHDYDDFSNYFLDVMHFVREFGGKEELVDRDTVEDLFIRGTKVKVAADIVTKAQKRP